MTNEKDTKPEINGQRPKAVGKPLSTLLYIFSMSSRKTIDAVKLALPAALQTEQRVRATNDMLMSYYGNDSNLAFVGYSLLFISELVKLIGANSVFAANTLSGLSNSKLVTFTASLLAKLDPAAVAAFVQHTRKASSLISDIRIFNRLWGIIPLTVWAFDTYHAPPKDVALRAIAYLQVFVNIVYQPLENVAYLAMHDIIGGVSESAQTKLWIRSCYFWAAHVVLEFFRLVREYQIAKRNAVAEAYKEAQDQAANEKKTDKALDSDSAPANVTPSTAAINKKVREAMAANKSGWIKGLIINFSYLPLTIHWSLETGCLTDLTVGFLGAAAAAANIVPKWKAISTLTGK